MTYTISVKPSHWVSAALRQRTAEHIERSIHLEWMIEFPEVLNENGTFEGFDIIIGNPPYISLEKLPIASPVYESMRRIDEDSNVGQKTYNTYN